MNKKLIFVIFLIMLLAVPAFVFGDATVTTGRNIRTAGSDQGFSQTTAIGGARSGKVLEIDNRGSASVFEYPKTVTSIVGSEMSAGKLVHTGAARLTSITVSGLTTSAADYVLVYDALSATGTPKFEVSIAVTGETYHINIPGGAQFSTGIFVVGIDTEVFATVTYDF